MVFWLNATLFYLSFSCFIFWIEQRQQFDTIWTQLQLLRIPKRSFLPVQPVLQCRNAFLSRGIAISVNFVACGTLSFGTLAYSQNGIFSTFVCFGHNHFATNRLSDLR